MENKLSNIAKAIISVMREVKGIDKSMTVGTGANSYKGVPDQEVKKIIGESMAKHGLCILPISITPKTEISRWEEDSQYGKKQKQSVFTEVTTKYILLHESGESIELSGYGHGVDTQDKGAGKATTYALKYTLLYSFLVPTGKIDDADTIHSDDIETPTKQAPKKPWLNTNTQQWTEAVKYLQGDGTIEKIKLKYSISKENEEKLKNAVLEAA